MSTWVGGWVGGTHHGGDVLVVLLVGEAVVHLDGGQGFQDRGAQVKQGGGTVVGGVLQGQKGRGGWAPTCRQGGCGPAGLRSLFPHLPSPTAASPLPSAV